MGLLGLFLWDVLVLRTPRFREKSPDSLVPGAAGWCVALLAVVSMPCAIAALWFDPAGLPHIVLLQVWVLLRFVAFIPMLYIYASNANTTPHRIVVAVVSAWAVLIFGIAAYLIYYVWTGAQPGDVQVFLIYNFLGLGIFISAVIFAETFEADSQKDSATTDRAAAERAAAEKAAAERAAAERA